MAFTLDAEDKALILGATVAGLTAASDAFVGTHYSIFGVIFLSIALVLKAVMKPKA